MALDGRLLARARERLGERRAENYALRDRREAEVYEKSPALRETDAALRRLVPELVRRTAERDAAALADVGRRSVELCGQKAEALVALGYPADYLDEIVSCPRCGDTGYLKTGEMCSCLRELYEEERARDLSAALKLGEERFADFRLDYYAGEAREQMALTLDICRAYAVNFGPGSPNLLFQGGTGLGKTFLSGCIAAVVSDRGFSVAYEPVQEAFAAFEAQKFSRDGETYAAASEKVERMLGCDLLILDDLGTEMTTSFTQSALYNILNSRLTAGRKTIVSTNLSDGELEKRYLPQTFSRLNGEFDTVLFTGRDIRAIRKERRYL